jgi:hypothetical protein
MISQQSFSAFETSIALPPFDLRLMERLPAVSLAVNHQEDISKESIWTGD